MKFTNEKYPFIRIIEEGRYDRIEHLPIALELLKMKDIRDYRNEYYGSTFREALKNNFEQLYELLPNVKECFGCEIELDGSAWYYHLNPDQPYGLKAIRIIAPGDKYLPEIFKNLKDREIVNIITNDLFDKCYDEVKKPRVGFFFQSKNFTRDLNSDPEIQVWNPLNRDQQIPEALIVGLAHKFMSWFFIDLFKKYVKTEIQIVGDESGHTKYFSGIKVHSDFPIRVFQYDRSYWTEIIRDLPFNVSAHLMTVWCGKGRTEKKRVLRHAYTKNGYHRRAKKDI